MIKIVRNESGSVTIVVALIMVVLIGFTAFVIDYGSLSSEKRKLQNAVDAACLAGAQYLPGKVQDGKNAAADFLAANEPGAALTSVSLNNGNKRITVTASMDAAYTFARAFTGKEGTKITATATADITNALGAYDYALFSGSEIDLLQFTGQNSIYGDVHSNSNVKNSATVDGTVTASGIIDGKINAVNKVQNYNTLKMPDLSNLMKVTPEVSQTVLATYGITYNSGTYTASPDQLNALMAAYANTPVFINGSLVINGSGVCTAGSLIASGDITFNGSGVDMSAGNAICLVSLNGSITFDGGGGQFNGILFSPKGGVNFNGKINKINGSVIGNTIKGSGGLTIHYDSNAKNSLPDTEITLVE